MRHTHPIITAYGFWLPNDPRGSGSTRIRAQHLYQAGGDATRVVTRRSVAARPHDAQLRLETKAALKRPVVRFAGVQARAIARGIALQLPKVELRLHAVGIMPDHLHAVVATSMPPGKVIGFLKACATRGLNAEGLHPFAAYPWSNGVVPSPWAAKGWKVFLESDEDVRRTIQDVEQNPVKAGLKRQQWPFVEPFESAGRAC